MLPGVLNRPFLRVKGVFLSKMFFVFLLFGILFFAAGWFCTLIVFLLLMLLELCIIIYRYIATGSLYPGSLLLLGLLEHDEYLGYNLKRNWEMVSD